VDSAITPLVMEAADRAMLDQLRSHCVQVDGDPLKLMPGTTDGAGGLSLIQSATAIKEAFTWLKDRKLANLDHGQHGQYIRLTLPAGVQA
jgi:hypothetical protein